jgi:hypothetical protein
MGAQKLVRLQNYLQVDELKMGLKQINPHHFKFRVQ